MSTQSCTCRRGPEDLLTVSEAAAIADASEKTIRRQIWGRVLPHLRVGARSIRIRRGDLEVWLHQGHVPALRDRVVL